MKRFSPLRSLCMAALLAAAGSATAQQVTLTGFNPFVGFGMTDESKTLDAIDLGDIPFIADPASSLGAPLLGSGGSPYFGMALFDSGAATHIFTQEAFNGLDIIGAGLQGTNKQIIGGATGQIELEINDAAGVYVAGMADRTASGASLALNQSVLRGQTSLATLTAPAEWTLPNIIGLPMAVHHAVAIRNDEPQVFTHQGRTVRTPQVDFLDLGAGALQGITRRVPLNLRPGIGFVQGPQFVFNLDLNDILLGNGKIDIANNPASPSVVIDSNGNGGGLFLDVDMARGDRSIDDKGFLFDTGADLTVVSELTAVRLGFDPILDTPDFILQVEGSGGVQGGVPGFYVDELRLDSIGGSFVKHNVPVAVLDVTNPNDPGNVIDGILGTHLFNDRNIVIDANPSIGQGGVGPSLFISDPITKQNAWSATAAAAPWNVTTSWSRGATPGELDAVKVASQTGGAQTARVVSDEQVFSLEVGGVAGELTLRIEDGSLTVFGETSIQQGGVVRVDAGQSLDAHAVNLEGGVLTGGGEIFVGNGPLHGAVRNVAGRVEPTGQLTIEGDLANLSDGVLAFEVGGATNRIDATRFAFLAGELEVTLASGYTPTVNDSFTLITADEGIEGEFEGFSLPTGYLWDIAYNPMSVVVQFVGVGLEGDFNGDNVVDASDYAVWRAGFGTTYTMDHYQQWRAHFGESLAPPAAGPVAAPAPGAALLASLALLLAATVSRSLPSASRCSR